MLDTLTRETFAPLLNQTFQLSTEDGPVFEVELIEVEEVPGTPNQRKPFSAVFLAPAEPLLGQAIYSLSHQDLGPGEDLGRGQSSFSLITSHGANRMTE